MDAEEGERWGFHNRIVKPQRLLEEAHATALQLARGPAFAHAMTKMQLGQEWNVSLETAIEMERTQAICMTTSDFRRAFEAFADKRTPEFEGNSWRIALSSIGHSSTMATAPSRRSWSPGAKPSWLKWMMLPTSTPRVAI